MRYVDVMSLHGPHRAEIQSERFKTSRLDSEIEM